MCGIAGIVKLNENNTNIPLEQIKELLLTLQTRGKDATGVAAIDRKNKVAHFIKRPGPSSNLISSENFKDFYNDNKNADIWLLHCRAATHGSPKDNKNNHPVYTKHSLLIHNGIVGTQNKYPEALGETDSEQFLLAIENMGIEKAIETSDGSLTFAYYDLRRSYKLFLYKRSTSLWLGLKENILYFASEYGMLVNLFPRRLDIFLDIQMRSLKDNELLIIDLEKMQITSRIIKPQIKVYSPWFSDNYVPLKYRLSELEEEYEKVS